LLDLRLVDLGSTLIYVGEYGCWRRYASARIKFHYCESDVLTTTSRTDE